MNIAKEILGWIGIIAMILTPIIWGVYFYKYRRNFRSKRNDGTIYRQRPLVMCKDCIHYRYYGLTEDTVSECRINHCENPDKEWFCADGQREN